MAGVHAAKQAASAAAAAAAAAGAEFERIPTLDIVTHVMTPVPVAVIGDVAKQFAYATTALHGIALAGTASAVWKNAAGLALQRIMRCRNHGLDRLPVLPGAAQGALSALLICAFPPDDESAPAGAAAPPAAATAAAAASGQVAFDAASLAALRALASSSAAATSKPEDPIVLGYSKIEDGGTLRRPEFFSVGDVAAFEEHEDRLVALAGLPKPDQRQFGLGQQTWLAIGSACRSDAGIRFRGAPVRLRFSLLQGQ